MTWARFDDRFPWHRKIRRLSDGAFRLHVTAICACAQDLTDGHLTRADLEDLPTMRFLDKRVDELVAAGAWVPDKGGWLVHDYLDYNPSRAQVQAERAAARDRQAKRRRNRLGRWEDPDDDVTA